MKIRSKADLDKWRLAGWKDLSADAPTVWVGMASCGLAAGGGEVFEALEKACAGSTDSPRILKTGCIGFCQMEPLVELRLPGKERLLYGPVTPQRVSRWSSKTDMESLFNSEPLARMQPLPEAEPEIDQVLAGIPDHPFYRHQVRISSRHCGLIDPENILHALALGAYQAIARSLATASPEQIIDVIARSGLRGRGGAGFPTGKKWEITRRVDSDSKYVVCNADEGDPGAYMDRSLLEGDPHSVIEGMLLGAYAVGAERGIVYVRREYPLAIHRLQTAIAEARRYGLLGDRILNSDFSFDLDLVEGSGAFVSGEETALMASIEGRQAEPRPRPPYPAVEGLYGRPTVINNVESWATVPIIIARGADWYATYGTERSKGTKVFSLVGAVANTGLVEVPFGTTIRDIVEEIGGGPRAYHQLKAVQTGGPSGGCIPADRFDLPVDYETLQAEGSIMGSGGMVVLDDGACMVDIAKYFLDFTCNESCGKCTPCREGLDRMREILEWIASGEGTEDDLERLRELAAGIQDASLCGLGKSAPNPVLTTVQYFRDEYLAHIEEKRCPAGVCRELISYRVLEDFCSGCHACVRVCPVDAVSGEKGTLHRIDQDTCIKCGTCREVCPDLAVHVE